MSEDSSNNSTAPAPDQPPQPLQLEAQRATRVYMAEVFGQTFAVEAGSQPAVIAYLVRRLRREIKMRVGDFDDGRLAEAIGVKTEVASADDNAAGGAA